MNPSTASFGSPEMRSGRGTRCRQMTGSQGERTSLTPKRSDSLFKITRNARYINDLARRRRRGYRQRSSLGQVGIHSVSGAARPPITVAEPDLTQIHPVKPFLEVLSGRRQPVPPIWMMRQAGRYLPEYRELRARAGGFLDLCFTPVYEALRRVRRELDAKIALIGFCGAPWTVATYMVAGQGTPDQAPARMMAYRHPEAFAKIIDVLVENSIHYLLGQLRAGADALQIFDTWAGVLPPREFQRWSIEPARRIVEGVRAKMPDAKIIGFPRGAGALLPAYVDATGVDAVSIDWAAEPSMIRERVQNRIAVQGNLDPLVLIAGGAVLDRAIDDVLTNYASGRLIFNLGHGIQPETPIAHVEQMIKRVRTYRG